MFCNMIIGSQTQGLNPEIQACLYSLNSPELFKSCVAQSTSRQDERSGYPEGKFFKS